MMIRVEIVMMKRILSKTGSSKYIDDKEGDTDQASLVKMMMIDVEGSSLS